jgi:DNA-binding winged helix-turn-helix (wHTH) protein
VLLALAERPGRLLSKHQLMDLVCPGLVVQENNLAAQVHALRKVVGEAVIATIPGRGYRFVARAEPIGVLEHPAPARRLFSMYPLSPSLVLAGTRPDMEQHYADEGLANR